MLLFGEAGLWFAQQPPCSRWLLVLSLAIPVGMQLGVVPVSWVYYDWRLITMKLQLWRAATCLFLSKPSISFLFNCFFRYQYSVQLESTVFSGPAEYLYFLALSAIGLNLLNGAVLGGLATLWDAFSMVIAYVWCKYFPETMVSFLFGIRFRAKFLPVAMLAMDAVMGGNVTGGVLGVVVGHLYYFVKEEWPGGRALAQPPRILQVLLESKHRIKSGSAVHDSPVLHPFSGSGRRLGG